MLKLDIAKAERGRVPCCRAHRRPTGMLRLRSAVMGISHDLGPQTEAPPLTAAQARLLPKSITYAYPIHTLKINQFENTSKNVVTIPRQRKNVITTRFKMSCF